MLTVFNSCERANAAKGDASRRGPTERRRFPRPCRPTHRPPFYLTRSSIISTFGLSGSLLRRSGRQVSLRLLMLQGERSSPRAPSTTGRGRQTQDATREAEGVSTTVDILELQPIYRIYPPSCAAHAMLRGVRWRRVGKLRYLQVRRAGRGDLQRALVALKVRARMSERPGGEGGQDGHGRRRGSE